MQGTLSKLTIVFSIIALVWICINLIICLSILILLYVKRNKQEMFNYAVWQLILTMVDMSILGFIFIFRMFFYDESNLSSNRLLFLIIDLGVLAFVMS